MSAKVMMCQEPIVKLTILHRTVVQLPLTALAGTSPAAFWQWM